jgi:hypothetical protein
MVDSAVGVSMCVLTDVSRLNKSRLEKKHLPNALIVIILLFGTSENKGLSSSHSYLAIACQYHIKGSMLGCL